MLSIRSAGAAVSFQVCGRSACEPAVCVGKESRGGKNPKSVPTPDKLAFRPICESEGTFSLRQGYAERTQNVQLFRIVAGIHPHFGRRHPLIRILPTRRHQNKQGAVDFAFPRPRAGHQRHLAHRCCRSVPDQCDALARLRQVARAVDCW